jgi:hypothetical protein
MRRASLRIYGLPAVLLALGLLGAALLVIGDWIRERLILRDIGRIHALGEIDTSVATAHLWIEEHVSGDEVLADGDIDEHLERARALAAALLGDDEAAAAVGEYDVRPLEDRRLLRRAAELAAGIDRFSEVLRRRQQGYAAAADVGIGSPLDEEQDKAFQEVVLAAGSLDSVIGVRILLSHRRSRLLFRLLLAAWVVIVVIAMTGIAARERWRAVAEATLRERVEELQWAR